MLWPLLRRNMALGITFNMPSASIWQKQFGVSPITRAAAAGMWEASAWRLFDFCFCSAAALEPVDAVQGLEIRIILVSTLQSRYSGPFPRMEKISVLKFLPDYPSKTSHNWIIQLLKFVQQHGLWSLIDRDPSIPGPHMESHTSKRQLLSFCLLVWLYMKSRVFKLILHNPLIGEGQSHIRWDVITMSPQCD